MICFTQDFHPVKFMTKHEKTGLAYLYKIWPICWLYRSITLVLNVLFAWIFCIKAERHRKSYKTYWSLVSYTEKEISIKIWTGVFCAHKSGFLLLSHILSIILCMYGFLRPAVHNLYWAVTKHHKKKLDLTLIKLRISLKESDLSQQFSISVSSV